ncbi:MAG: YifB family Mg chelatase-like AAA ATPase [Pelagibacterales bacterium]|nr:YifB family Mg chelatase-like AAA ATPase [Pelagibacterales bacterium]
MVATIKTFAFLGVDVVEVSVQVKISEGIANFAIVGLPDKAVGESKERVRAAISSIGLSWPYKKITVNLAPADLQKEGGHFDLPIALGILIEMGILEQKAVDNFFVLGELSLDGSINSINGTISASIGANERNCGIICPQVNGKEAAWAGDLEILAAPNLIALINHFKGEQFLSRPENNKNFEEIFYPDLSDIKGQEGAKRALEIAAAGGHNILFIGPPGTGKSMLSSRLPGILPPPTLEEILEINMIHSISGNIVDGKLVTSRPYREPHHSCSMPAMIGGGTKAKPGEVSLAHNGILFLDELAEFSRQVLDSLRQPLESGNVSVSRVNSRITYPASFQLVTAMNPCRCGFLGDANRECKKAPNCGEDYKNKISGPLLDRIDIAINVPQVDIFASNLSEENYKSESSKEIAIRVSKARKVQEERYKNEESMQNLPKLNSKINGKTLEKFTKLDDDCRKILQKSVEKMATSMRGITRILRVARTIADLEMSEDINQNHLLEAISYRRKI